MVSSKQLINMARKWKKMAMISRRRITIDGVVPQSCGTSTLNKGHFVVYTADQKRFVCPLCYLNNGIFKELLKIAEEEFGHQKEGPITLSCDSSCLEYAISMIRRRVSKDLEKALLMTITSFSCFSTLSILEGLKQHQMPISGF